ncbi:MAG: hypothetical protein ABEJ98_00065 [Candidatus Nanohaloarchaea archaeon]
MITDKIGYLIYWILETGTPLTDLDGLGVIAHKFPIVAQVLPLVEPIDYNRVWHDTSWFGAKGKLLILLVVPFVDLEFFKMLGMNPMKDFEKAAEQEAELESAEFDPTASGGQPVTNRRAPRSSGGGGEALQAVGKVLKYVALAALPLALIFGALTMVGGSGYGQLAGNVVGNQIAGVNFEAGFDMVRQGVQTLQCFGNAACMRAWRYNNTQRPGSEAVGQSYSLQVEDFAVNGGHDLDIAGRRATFDLPVSFSLYNPRHGLKGIPARNTSYRVRVEDLQKQEKKAYCDTGWVSIGGRYASKIEGVKPGTIIPGGFATPVSGMEKLSLYNCGLLQPGLGLTRRVALDVRYEYSSQATLYFEAMSMQNLRSLGERPEFKKSQTADTPVKSYVNVESPVTFRQSGGRRASRVFRVRLGMSTDRRDIKYRFDPEEFRLYDSSKTIDVENAEGFNSSSATCQGLQRVGENTYKLSESRINYTKRLYRRGKWFEKGSGMSPVSCSMVLEKDELSTLSPSGETLTMRIDANYTVKVEKSENGFKVLNGRCGTTELDCPLLVPHNKTLSNPDLISSCTTAKSLDAANGCDVRMGERWHIVNKINRDSVDQEIEQGETAYLWENMKQRFSEPSDEAWKNSSDFGAIGMKKEELAKLEAGGYTLIQDEEYGTGDDVRLEKVEKTLCIDSGTAEQYMKYWVENNDVDSVLYFNPRTTRCGVNTLASRIVDLYFAVYDPLNIFGYKTPKEKFKKLDTPDNIVLLDGSGFQAVKP